jgi:epoxyqueuosine reductase
VVGAQPYRSDTPTSPARHAQGRVARYVRDDAYDELARALEVVARRLRDHGFKAVVVADQNTLVDRAAAHRAGLGWYGKSSNLLLPGQGSWFVLGSVVTDADLPVRDEPMGDGCGSCQRCIDGCPTGAIVAPGIVDARRCLAWLVQSPDPFPLEHREALGDRLYGCDDCQEVCPPNRRAGTQAVDPGALPARTTWVDLVDLLDSDDATLLDRHGRWYIPRRDPRYLRRTALVVLGNIGDAEDPDVGRVIDRYRTGDDPLLAEHASWAAARLGLPDVEPAGVGD